ncbi:hypothetical protein [Aureimonas ureilytica]|uniref:hypothetical protein n=1 Tax=Aureimonas ureilytica TaxID=401562 RepID=UPI0003697B4E|nr:hypothetical protein [Aureimonas ureilytica]
MAGSQLDEIEGLLRKLLTHVLDVKMKYHDIDGRLRLLEQKHDQHHQAMYEWCGPEELRKVMEMDFDMDLAEMPDDIAGLMAQFTKPK